VLKRIARFRALPLESKLLFIRAWLMLGWYRAAIGLVSFKRLSTDLHHSPAPELAATPTRSQREQAAVTGRLVAQAATVTPWNSPCLVQVLVVQRLLAARGIPGQFYLGASHYRGEPGQGSELSAHAWLQCGDCIVNGEEGHELFEVLSTYSWGGRID
jgi:hypothetical protein